MTLPARVAQITIGLFDKQVPKTVANFKELCSGSRGFGYQGSKFHRVIPNFMVRCCRNRSRRTRRRQ